MKVAVIAAAGENLDPSSRGESSSLTMRISLRQPWICRQLPKPVMLQIAPTDTACVLSANICKPTRCACVLIKMSQVLSVTDAWQITKTQNTAFIWQIHIIGWRGHYRRNWSEKPDTARSARSQGTDRYPDFHLSPSSELLFFQLKH